MTGISGSGRNEYVRALADYARSRGKDPKVFEVGEMMFSLAESLGIKILEGKILDLSASTLNYLRTTVFERILRESRGYEDVIISTHACFRWRRHLLQGLDFYYLNLFNPDLYASVVDEVIPTCLRLERSAQWRSRLGILDVLTWRDEEVFLTKSIADFQRKPFYILPRRSSPETLYRLMYEGDARRVYLSYPITHAKNDLDLLAGKDRFKDRLRSLGMVVFDPGQIDDVSYLNRMLDAKDAGEDFVEFKSEDAVLRVDLRDLPRIKESIYDQIVARDYQLIDQSDLLIVYYYLQVMSPGVLSEMAYGFSNNKDVFVVFRGPESPFFHYYSTRIFKDEEEIFAFLEQRPAR